MRMICVRWVADLLKHPTLGVNAIAGQENRFPDWPAVPLVEVFDETRELWLANKTLPSTVLQGTPFGLVIARMGTSESDALPYSNGYASVTIGIRVIARVKVGQTPRHDIAVMADQLLRNVERVLKSQLKGYVAEQLQVIPGVDVVVPDDDNLCSNHSGRAELDGGLVMDLLEVHLSAHDGWALDVYPPPTS